MREAENHKISLRLFLYDALHSPVAHSTFASVLNFILITLIISSVVVLSLETVDSLYNPYQSYFQIFEYVTVGMFTLEYLIRIWVCVENPIYRLHPVHPNAFLNAIGIRIKYIFSIMALVDLLAFLPFYLTLLFPAMAGNLLFLRLLRMVRILKLSRYSPALHTFIRVLQTEARTLMGALIIMGAMLVLSSNIIYIVESDVQPDKFSSIPAAMWWSIATLTTVGYGDVAPVTPLGQIFGAFVMVTGIGLFVLWTSILSGAFTTELQRTKFNITPDLLSDLPVMSTLPEEALEHITRTAVPIIIPERYALLRRGENVDGVYFIVEGVVEIDMVPERELLRTGDHFGEAGVFNDGLALVDVITLSHTRLLMIDATNFHQLCEQYDDFRALMEMVAKKRGYSEQAKNNREKV